MAQFSMEIMYFPGSVPGGNQHRCPHCSIASPNMNLIWSDRFPGHGRHFWATYRCESCKGVVTVLLVDQNGNTAELSTSYPETKTAHEDVPEPARRFLQQAFDTLHAPDAAAVMAGSAVDAMLKELGYTSNASLYARIDKALAENALTKGMADWAHSVRLGSNRPRHADAEKPHVSREEAKQSVEFAEALGQFLFVLTKRIERGIAAANQASE